MPILLLADLSIGDAGAAGIAAGILAGLSAGLPLLGRVFVAYLVTKDALQEKNALQTLRDRDDLIERYRVTLQASDVKDAKHDAELRMIYEHLLKMVADMATTQLKVVSDTTTAINNQTAALGKVELAMVEVKTTLMALTDRVGRIESSHDIKRITKE